MPEQTIEIEVLRYRPETDDEPGYQTYTVPYQDDWSVLDALNHIKDHLDGSLSYRWSCHMAVCGSCGMMIDDVAHLSCKTFLREYYPNKIKLDPLANFPIERDLVVNIEGFLEKLESVKPYLIHAADDPFNESEYRQTPAELARFQQYTMCINCLLCYSACPEFALDPEFTGPAALTLAHRYNLDARDQGKAQRIRLINTEKGVWPCMFVGACSEVCPKQVDPAAAIQQLKVASVFDWYKSLLPFQDSEQENMADES